MVLSTVLFTVTFNQPRAALLFIAAGTVILGLYFVVPPSDDEASSLRFKFARIQPTMLQRAHPIMSSFLRRIPDVFTAVGCALIVLGICITFPNEVALIPLLLFVSFAALAALFGMVLDLWMTVTLYGAALVSLATFVVFAFMA